VKTTCNDCGAELEITDEGTFVKCFKCGNQAMVDVAPPWALSGLDYIAPPPTTGNASDPPPPPLRHDHAPPSHRAELLSPLSGELVEGDDLVYVTCENCRKEFEGNASFLRCPFCGVTNTVDTAPPWAVSGDLVQEVTPQKSSSVPPPPPQRPKGESSPPAKSAELWQEWKAAEVTSDGTRRTGSRSAGGPGMFAAIAVVLAVGAAGVVMWATNEDQEAAVVEAPVVASRVPAPDLDIDQVEQVLEGVANAGVGADWSCEKALANYEAHRDPDIEFAPVPEGVFGEILNEGSYLEKCRVPSSTPVDVCAAIQRGRAVGVTVTTDPSDPILEKCIAVRVRELKFPSYPALQVAKSAFVPLEEQAAEEEPERVPGPLPTVAAIPSPGRLPASSAAPAPAPPVSRSDPSDDLH